MRLDCGTLFSDADVLTGSSGSDWFVFDSTRDRVTDPSGPAFAGDPGFIGG
ncbi:MAG TPA: hypothetical protein VM597_05730 [Gemmataceae bacterium]|nr:hypothetical protein [Gemmataceae bacterium]